jgi:hypothetical protein
MNYRPYDSVTTHTTIFDLSKSLSEIKGVDPEGSTVMESNKILNFVLRETKIVDDSVHGPPPEKQDETMSGVKKMIFNEDK